jgi:hypothetical protein
MATFRVGKNAKVTIGSTTVVGMGTWKLDGVSTDQIETTAFQDNWKTYVYGCKDGGTITFSGFYDPSDTTHVYLIKANNENTALTTLRFYIDNTSWFEANQTIGYLDTTNTSLMDTKVSSITITGLSIGQEKGGVASIDFTAKISGNMVLR